MPILSNFFLLKRFTYLNLIKLQASLENNILHYVIMLKLEFPNESHKDQYLEMIKEWKNYEKPTSPWRLFSGDTYEDFLRIVTKDLTDNEYGVNSTLFFLVEDTGPDILGAIQVRYHINHPKLIETWGHIGYGIRPSARRKGYAMKMLELTLKEAKKLWIDRILITCDHDNIASVKVIEENGWKFEWYMQRDWVKSRRYWINLL